MMRVVITGLALLAAAPAHAGLTRIVVERTEPAAAAGYEILSGRFHGELDPRAARNRIITDLQLAPRNAHGRVAYSATFRLARPTDPARRSGVLMYDVPNRGRIITGFLRGAGTGDPGGHVWAVSGWQGDLAPAANVQSASVPLARGPAGRAVTGPILARFTRLRADARDTGISSGLDGGVARPAPVSLDTRRARLWIETRDGGRRAVPAGAWAFADCRTRAFPGAPDGGRLCLRSGFDPDAAYTLAYEGRDPPVLGIGFAATRDLVAFLRSGRPDATGAPNPAGTAVRWTIGTGASQSGNFLRSFVHLGFNTDERGRRVFDGINPQIAARQVPLNLRFGAPGGAAGVFEPGSEGVLWWGRHDDRTRGLGPASLLDRCTADRTCPRVVETFGSAEFWGLRMSPDLVGADARRDIPLPADVRRYYFPGTAHGGGQGKGFATAGDPRNGTCLLPANPNPSSPNLRAVQKALLDWVTQDRPPPPSRYPTLAAGDLVEPTARALGWPAIPGAPTPDGKLNPFVDQDFGRAFRRADLSGVVLRQPPVVRRTLPSRVPRVDADGNETAGVPSVHLQAPLGAYTGWNVQAEGFERGGPCGFEAGFIPFARTRAERLAKGDPRLSLEERYVDHAGFVARVRTLAGRQVSEGWLLPADAERIVRDAQDSDVLR